MLRCASQVDGQVVQWQQGVVRSSDLSGGPGLGTEEVNVAQVRTCPATHRCWEGG